MAATAAAQVPVPDEDVGPTPRSQIRMRTRSGASTSASSTLVPSGKYECTASAPPSRCSRSSVTAPITTHCGLPTRSTTALTGSPATVSSTCRISVGLSHARPEGQARPRGRCQHRDLRAQRLSQRRPQRQAKGLRRRAIQAATHRTPLPDTSDRLPSALNRRIRAARASSLHEHQTVCARRRDAGDTPLAQTLLRRCPTPAARARSENHCRTREL